MMMMIILVTNTKKTLRNWKRTMWEIRDELGKYKKTLMKELAKKYPHLGDLNRNNDHFGTSNFKKQPQGCGQKKRKKWQGRFYCLFTNKDIYVRGSFETREKAGSCC